MSTIVRMFKVLAVIAFYASTVLSQTTQEASQGSPSPDVNLDSLPACAQTCLGNSTTQQGSCTSVDIKCLCGNEAYVNTLACCLATTCNAADQQTAGDFNTNLCASVNVTLPNYLGCPQATTINNVRTTVQAEIDLGSYAASSSTLAKSKTSAATATSTGAAAGVGTLEPGYSLATTGPVATFTGSKILTGTCATAQYATITTPAGGILEYPWVGCSYEDPGCCPFDVNVGGMLSVCPADYTTTSGACCPSGWSVYSTALAGETPCYSSANFPFPPPTITSSKGGPSISVISTQQFTLRYPLARSKSRMSKGAIAGTAVGVSAGVAFILLAMIFLVRRHTSKSRVNHKATASEPIELTSDEITSPQKSKNISELDPSSPAKTMSELQTPQSATLPDRSMGWDYQKPMELPGALPIEMAGSTFLNEHHPSGSFTPVDRAVGKHNYIRDSHYSQPDEASPAYTPAAASMLAPESAVPVSPYIGSSKEGELAEEEHSPISPETSPNKNEF